VIAIPKIRDELERGPFRAIPDWFPVHLQNESLFILDHAHLDSADLDGAAIYQDHLGTSDQVPDAIIADSADALADILVTEDGRCLKRLNDFSKKCLGLKYDQFTAWLEQLETNGRSCLAQLGTVQRLTGGEKIVNCLILIENRSRESGGIGRRAGFRILWGNTRGGSIPPFRTKNN
jgi:hypothetical protein